MNVWNCSVFIFLICGLRTVVLYVIAGSPLVVLTNSSTPQDLPWDCDIGIKPITRPPHLGAGAFGFPLEGGR